MIGSSKATTMERVLVDTNVLVRLVQLSGIPDEELASMLGEYNVCTTFQNLAEFWSVATRRAVVNGLGLSIEAVSERVEKIRQVFEVLPDEPASLDIWVEICKKYQVSGKRVHDARIVATALANGVTVIATRNHSDFQGFQEVSMVDLKSTESRQ